MNIELTLMERIRWFLFKDVITNLDERIKTVDYVYHDSDMLKNDLDIMTAMIRYRHKGTWEYEYRHSK